MPIVTPNVAQAAGIPSQWDDTITSAEVTLITGNEPAVMTEDVLVAVSQTLEALTPVGFDDSGALAPATVGGAAGVQASGVLTFSGTGTDADTVTIGTRTYTLKTAAASADQVKIGATAAETAANLTAAINGGAGSGTLYGTGTVPHAVVNARVTGAVVTVTAKAAGTAANSLGTTEAGTGTSFGAATLANGTAGTGVRAVGITVFKTVATASPVLGVALYRAGCFNPRALNWPSSFMNDDMKMNAFRGAPTPTNIILRRPKTATVVLP